MKIRKFFPLVVVAAGLLAYHNSFTGSFVHDDHGSIIENPTIRHLWPIWECLSFHGSGWTVAGRPLINLSLAINYAISGYNVWSYHGVNLGVHILAGLTLFGIVRRTLLLARLRVRFGGVANELALVTAVFWTIHPLQTESVTYIIQRAESIMGLFYLLTLYCFIRGIESQWARLWQGLSVAACALGMASKEVMVTAPVMVMLYDRAFVSESFHEVWQRRRPLYLALGSTWVVLGFVLASASNFTITSMNAQRTALSWWQYLVAIPLHLRSVEHFHFSWWDYLATQPGLVLHYLRLSVWPHPLCFESNTLPIAKTWMSILPRAIVVVTLLGAWIWAWGRSPIWGFVGAWFFVILAPSSAFAPALGPMHDHRMYLSLAAVVSVLVMGLYLAAGRQSWTVFVVVGIGLGFLTWRQNQVYCKDPHYNLGLALAAGGRFQEAVGQYEQALRTTPDDAMAHYNLGVVLHQLGKAPEAFEHYEQAVRIKPDLAEAYNNLGAVMENAARTTEAIAYWEQAVRIKPDYAEAQNNLGVALDRLGRVSEAIEHYEHAVRIKPDNPEMQYGFGVALLRLGRVPEAIGRFERALRIRPDYADAHYALGLALEQVGRVQEAIGHYEEAVRIEPGHTKAKNALMRLRAAQ